MSINIFSGSSGSSNKSSKRGVATSSAAARAAAVTSALGSGAVASDSGSTAVQSNGVLGKVGGFLNKISSVAQYMPGMVGTIGGIVNKLTSANDPEWWNTVPGDGLTCNDPFQYIEYGENVIGKLYAATSTGTYTDMTSRTSFGAFRPTFLEFSLLSATSSPGGIDYAGHYAIRPTDNMIVQYLMPHIRSVVNAVYLQDATHYKTALMVQATMYALWRQLKKYDWFLKHGKPYVPNVNLKFTFPLFEVEHASFLQSTITRLEEYLHANVRLPHTLCEYLTWRFGRIYKTNQSAKSAFVFYDVVPLTAYVDGWNNLIQMLQNEITNVASVQKAATDIYNAYINHDQEVFIAEDNMCAWDSKEFVLRTNLDLVNEAMFFGTNKISNNILMDSNLDNPTTFMASTVSCQVDPNELALFPVKHAYIYTYIPDYNLIKGVQYTNTYITGCEMYQGDITVSGQTVTGANIIKPDTITLGMQACHVGDGSLGSNNPPRWFKCEIRAGLLGPDDADNHNPWAYSSGTGSIYKFANFVLQSSLCKAMEFYNVGMYLPTMLAEEASSSWGPLAKAVKATDVTALTQDQGIVSDIVIKNEQILAFANLMAIEHRDKTTYRMVERRVARDLANTIEAVPIAELK